MDFSKYVQSRLRNCAQVKSVVAVPTENAELLLYLQKSILRKPYRKWKAGDTVLERLPHALAYTIDHKKPLTFKYWFGGYKLWRFDTSPTVDWAEFFALLYYIEYLTPIAQAHPYGVVLQFCSDEFFVEQLNNIQSSDTDQYTESFKKLIALVTPYLPDNFSITYTRNRDILGDEHVFREKFEEVVENVRRTWGSRRSPEELERDLASSWLNIRFDSRGSQDWSYMSDTQQREQALESLLRHDALGVFENPLIIDAHKDDSISIFAVSFPDSIGLGSTKNSMVKFWVGTGVLEPKGESYNERILSYKQYHDVLSKSRRVSVEPLLPYDAFSHITILNEMLDFNRV